VIYAAKRNRSRRRREKLNQEQGETGHNHIETTPKVPEETIMVDAWENPPQRTLEDYAIEQGPCHFSSIAIPTATKSVEMKPSFLSLISRHQFTGLAVYLRSFPFSLAGKSKEWLESHPYQSLTNWSDVEEKFLNRFFPLSRYIKAKSDISTF